MALERNIGDCASLCGKERPLDRILQFAYIAWKRLCAEMIEDTRAEVFFQLVGGVVGRHERGPTPE